MMRFALLLVLFSGFAAVSAADPQLAFDFTLIDKPGKNPLLVAWIEDDKGKFVRTLHVFGKAQKHFKDLATWWRKRGSTEPQKALDAVVGPTITWKQHVALKVPASDIRVGYVLRIEQGQEAKPDFHADKLTIPLTANWKGTDLKANVFFEQLSIKLEP